jgi:EmrB/QacA subfamily drug resistance transporter
MLTELSGRQKAIIMGSVMIGLFVSAMDQTVVSTATPRVVAELGGLNLYSWVFTSYMLTSTTLVPVVGKLGDMYGRKPLFIGGIVAFMLASVLAGVSQTIEQLIIFRGLQGVGAGLIMANSFTIIGDLFPPAERGKYQGLFSGVFGLASILGPFIGGYLTDNISWRWVFYVNIPIGIIALPALYFGLPATRPSGVKRAIDYAGTVTLILATVPLLLACVWVGEGRYDLLSPVTIVMLTFSALMIGAFVQAERRAAEPVLPMELFRNRVFSVSMLMMFVTGLAMFGVISFVPLFVQGAMGSSATRSGSVTMPMMIAMVTMSIVGGQLISRTGRYKVQSLFGTLLITAGIFLLSRMTADTSQAVASLYIILVGMGMGLSMPVFGVVVQNAVEHRLLGVVSAASQFFRQIGGTLGVAILGAALTSQLSGEISRTLPDSVRAASTPELLTLAEDPQTMLNPIQLNKLREGFQALGPDGPALFADALTTMRVALAHALNDVFLVGAGLMLVAIVVNLFLPEIPLRRTIRMAGEGMGEGAAPAEAEPRQGVPAGRA